MSTKLTQKLMVFDHLVAHGSLTSWQAIQEYRITRLSEYIRCLREDGKNIVSVWEHRKGKKWVRYFYYPDLVEGVK